MMRLAVGSPLTTIGPLSAPLEKPSALDRFRPAIRTFSPWQPTQCATSTGRILLSKNWTGLSFSGAAILIDPTQSTAIIDEWTDTRFMLIKNLIDYWRLAL